MTKEAFEALVAAIGLSPIPEKFRDKLRNVAFVIEDEPNDEVRSREGLSDEETLLGYYQGVPLTARGSDYGVGMTLPDVITIYREPTLDEAAASGLTVEEVVEDTIRHEVAHYLGMDEADVEEWEANNLRS